jgi:hypothetical protein
MLPIQQIFIKPSTPKLCAYTINTSPDLHSMTYEEMYFFIARLVSPEAANKAKELIDKKEAFFVDIEENKVYELSIDYYAAEQEARKILTKIDKKVIENLVYKSQTPEQKNPVLGIDLQNRIQRSILGIGGDNNEKNR